MLTTTTNIPYLFSSLYLTNLLVRIWYNSMFEQNYTQYTMLFYALLILQAYKIIKGHAFWSLLPSKMLFRVWSNTCIYKYIPWEGVVFNV